MAIKHLRMVEEFLKKNRSKSVTRTQIRNEFGVNYDAILECMAYLLEHKMIKKDKADRYQWAAKRK